MISSGVSGPTHNVCGKSRAAVAAAGPPTATNDDGGTTPATPPPCASSAAATCSNVPREPSVATRNCVTASSSLSVHVGSSGSTCPLDPWCRRPHRTSDVSWKRRCTSPASKRRRGFLGLLGVTPRTNEGRPARSASISASIDITRVFKRTTRGFPTAECRPPTLSFARRCGECPSSKSKSTSPEYASGTKHTRRSTTAVSAVRRCTPRAIARSPRESKRIVKRE